MDRAEYPGATRWFSECHVALRGYATSCTTLLPFPIYLYPYCCCVAKKEWSWKKLVTEQEVIAQETFADRRSRERGLPSGLMLKRVSVHFIPLPISCYEL